MVFALHTYQEFQRNMSEAIAPAPKNQAKTTIKTTIIANSIHHMGVAPKDTNQQQKKP